MEITLLIIGLLVGAAIGWFASQNKFQKKISEMKESYIPKSEFKDEQGKVLALTRELAGLEKEHETAEENLEKQKQELEEIQTRLKTEFKNIANELLEDKSKKFTEQNKENIENILNPLRERIKDFEEKVDKTYAAESAERISLKEQLKHLTELNKQISEEANNLARALKGESKKQGDWGELMLDKILEQSGLEEGRAYKKQVSVHTEEGKRYQPDVVVYLPDNKHIIIDSKVSLNAYDACINADNEEDKERFLEEHISAVRSHIKGLGEKNYQQARELDSPDFVLMFMPLESSFSVALQGDNELYQYAWDRKIVLVSPTTLLATLRTVASIWKQEKQIRNHVEISVKAGALYEKFKGLIEDLIEVGKKMDGAKDSYVEAMSKLHTGQGNLIKRVEDIKKLGAKTNKSLPQQLIVRAESLVEESENGIPT